MPYPSVQFDEKHNGDIFLIFPKILYPLTKFNEKHDRDEGELMRQSVLVTP